jgi:hypothetical protein
MWHKVWLLQISEREKLLKLKEKSQLVKMEDKPNGLTEEILEENKHINNLTHAAATGVTENNK